MKKNLDKIAKEIKEDVDSMGGALDKYNLTFERMAKILDDRVFNEEKLKKVDLKELRHFIDLVLKVRGGYAPDKKSIDGNFVVKWEDDKKKD
jgi:hypothetical protein